MRPGEDTVSFTERDVKIYLDSCIKFWRAKRDNRNVFDIREMKERDMALFYIDAYQSVRMSLFGELLEK